MKLDQLEKDIMTLVQKDGRESFVDIAEKVGVTEGTVRRRFYRLVDEGVIKISAVSDPFQIGFDSPAIIGLNVEPGRIDEIAEHLAGMEPIHFVGITTGDFDVIVHGVFSSNDELSRFVRQQISTIDGIVDINTSLLLTITKRSFEWGVPDNE